MTENVPIKESHDRAAEALEAFVLAAIRRKGTVKIPFPEEAEKTRVWTTLRRLEPPAYRRMVQRCIPTDADAAVCR